MQRPIFSFLALIFFIGNACSLKNEGDSGKAIISDLNKKNIVEPRYKILPAYRGMQLTESKNLKFPYNQLDPDTANKDTFDIYCTELYDVVGLRNWTFAEDLKWDKKITDSAFVFSLRINKLDGGQDSLVDIEIWYKLKPDQLFRYSCDLYYTLSTIGTFAKYKLVGGNWDWFEYKNRFFFIYDYTVSCHDELRDHFTPKLKKDTALLNYALLKLDKAIDQYPQYKIH